VSEPHNRFSGRSPERLTALTDGVFAVASIVALIVVQLYFIFSPRRLRIESLRSRRDDG
jgi:hypothetical protein